MGEFGIIVPWQQDRRERTDTGGRSATGAASPPADSAMSMVPPTSVSLLRTLAGDSTSSRWDEFYSRYEGVMRAFLRDRFPSLEPDDVIQETMAALVRKMPSYKYLPDRTGHFRNFLVGILKHKAMDALSRRSRESSAREALRNEPRPAASDDDAWRVSAMEVALAQLLADDSVNAMHRTVFRRVALMHEKPNDVAASLGISRANVDAIKKRMIERLSESVAQLTES